MAQYFELDPSQTRRTETLASAAGPAQGPGRESDTVLREARQHSEGSVFDLSNRDPKVALAEIRRLAGLPDRTTAIAHLDTLLTLAKVGHLSAGTTDRTAELDEVRVAAIKLIGELGEAASPALENLQRFCASRSGHISLAAAQALDQIYDALSDNEEARRLAFRTVTREYVGGRFVDGYLPSDATQEERWGDRYYKLGARTRYLRDTLPHSQFTDREDLRNALDGTDPRRVLKAIEYIYDLADRSLIADLSERLQKIARGEHPLDDGDVPLDHRYPLTGPWGTLTNNFLARNNALVLLGSLGRDASADVLRTFHQVIASDTQDGHHGALSDTIYQSPAWSIALEQERSRRSEALRSSDAK